MSNAYKNLNTEQIKFLNYQNYPIYGYNRINGGFHNQIQIYLF